MNTGFSSSYVYPEVSATQTLQQDSALSLPDSVSHITGSPTMVLIVLIAALWGLKIVGDSPRSGIDGAHIFVGPYNLLTITIASILGISLSKLVFNQFHVPDITDLVNAI